MRHSTANQRLLETIERIEGAYAPSTLRAYRSDFQEFIAYCDQFGMSALPASPLTLAGFISQLTKKGYRSASIRRAIAGIGSIHRLNHFADPSKDPEAILAMRRMHRTLGRASAQAYGITAVTLKRMIEATGNDDLSIRNRALLLVAYDSLCRRSELVSLRVEDIKVVSHKEQCHMAILLRRSKTDQDATGRWLHLTDRTVNALNEWLAILGNQAGFIFPSTGARQNSNSPLGVGQVNRIYKKLARKANLEQGTIQKISGHSFRVGAAQDLVAAGASLALIMNKGRWSKTDTVMRYVEHINFAWDAQ